MKNSVKAALFLSALLSLFNVVDAQEEKKNRLTPVLGSIESYRGQSILMLLKLRDVDYVMEKMTFYDSDNIDIVFDIAGYDKRKSKLREYMKTILPGANYKVRFTVKDIGPDGLLSGEIDAFWPEFTERLP